MKLLKFLWWFVFLFLLTACDPFGATVYQGSQGGSNNSGVYSSGTVQPQGGFSQRGQYVWEKAMQGLTMGGAVAGPYGAGGGLVIGLLAGLFTASQHEAQVTNQIQTEQAKDKELEGKIEQELESQRQLESQLGLAGASTSTAIASQQTSASTAAPVSTAAVTGSRTDKPNGATIGKANGTAALKKEPPVAVASVDKDQTAKNAVSAPFKNVEVRDINGDGIPDLWVYYNPLKPGEIVRQEEATHWDGRVDTWSYFKDGKLIRREVDTKSRGAADTVYFYENEKIVREDHDENGTGQVTSRIFYQNGRRAKVEEDTSGSGKMDHWIYYDTSQENPIIVKEEKDLNGDGIIDMWSYYENGRLARRDLSAAGLELLTDHDQPPASAPVPNPVPRPQLAREAKQGA